MEWTWNVAVTNLNVAIRKYYSDATNKSNSLEVLACKLTGAGSTTLLNVAEHFIKKTGRKRSDDVALMFKSDLENQYARDLCGNIKSIAANNLRRVLAIHVSRKLADRGAEARPALLSALSKATACVLLGRSGKLVSECQEDGDVDGDEALDDDDQAEVNEREFTVGTFRNMIDCRVKSFKKKFKTSPNYAEQAIVEKLCSFESFEALRAVFLPAYLNPLVNDWRNKLSKCDYANITLAWRLFADANNGEFTQQLVPTQSTGGRYWGFTHTMMVSFWASYLKHVAPSKIIKQLKSWCDERDYAFTEPKSSSISSLKKSWAGTDVWDVLFPGISKFVRDSSARNHRLKFGFYVVLNAASIKGLFYKEGSKTAIANGGFNSLSWRSHVDLNSQVDLGALIGMVKPDDGKLRGPSRTKGFKGRVDIEAMLRERFGVGLNNRCRLKTGLNAAKSFFDNRVVIAIDLGLKNMAGISASLGRINQVTQKYEGSFCKQIVTTKSFYSACHFNASPDGDMEIDGKQSHGRTMDVDEFNEQSEAFAKRHKERLKEWTGVDARVEKALRDRRIQKFLALFQNRLFAIVDHLHDKLGIPQTKAPVVIVGASQMSSMRGQKTPPSSSLVKFLSNSFTVLLLDEYFTSQKCPKCFRPLSQYGSGVRLKKCTNRACAGKDGTFIVNRDIAAPVNMTTIVLSLVMYGVRPRPFCPKREA
jgi:hypothetical protein